MNDRNVFREPNEEAAKLVRRYDIKGNALRGIAFLSEHVKVHNDTDCRLEGVPEDMHALMQLHADLIAAHAILGRFCGAMQIDVMQRLHRHVREEEENDEPQGT